MQEAKLQEEEEEEDVGTIEREPSLTEQTTY